MAVGIYTVTISREGFKTAEFKNVELAVGQPRTIDARLQVGSVAESVEVTASLETLNRTSAEVGGLIEAEQIKEIPVSGRNWASLMMLAPGAVNYSDGSQRNIRFNGHSIDDANYTFDGIDNNGVQEQTQKAETRLNIALDSIAEFRVSTAVYTAESGAAGGVQVQVVSKTGTNQFHGSTFYALRNDALDSRSPFDGATIPPFTLHQFGANFGGPIKKDKAFFFVNYEGLRQDLGVTQISYVPNAAFRAKVIAASPVLKPLMDAYPAGQIPPRRHHRPDQPGGQQHRARRFRNVPLRLPLQRQQHAVCPLQHRRRLHRQSDRCPGLAQRGSPPSHQCGSGVPAHLFAFHHQRSQVRRESRQLPQLELWHRARRRQRFVGLFQRPDQQLARYRGGHHVFLHRQPDRGPRPPHAEVRRQRNARAAE